MKVYVVENFINWEGGQVVGATTTVDAAKAVAKGNEFVDAQTITCYEGASDKLDKMYYLLRVSELGQSRNWSDWCRKQGQFDGAPVREKDR